MFHSSGNAPLNSIVGAQGKTACTSTTFSNKSINGSALITSNNGNAPNINGNAPILPTEVFCSFTEKELEKLEKKEKPENQKKHLFTRFLKSF